MKDELWDWLQNELFADNEAREQLVISLKTLAQVIEQTDRMNAISAFRDLYEYLYNAEHIAVPSEIIRLDDEAVTALEAYGDSMRQLGYFQGKQDMLNELETVIREGRLP